MIKKIPRPPLAVGVVVALAALAPAQALAANAAVDRVDMPLEEALRAVARSTGIRIVIKGALPRRIVSVNPPSTSLGADGALRHWLQGTSYAMVHSENWAAGDGAKAVVEVTFVEPKMSPGPRVVAPEASPTFHTTTTRRDPGQSIGRRPEERLTEELTHTALGGATAGGRTFALEALAYRGDGGALETIEQGLRNLDPDVRRATLGVIRDTRDQIPVWLVGGVARDDPHPTVRADALAVLVERAPEEARRPLRHALADPDEAVRERARELIGDPYLESGDDEQSSEPPRQ